MVQQAAHPKDTASFAAEAGERAAVQPHPARWERLFEAITDPLGVVSADNRLVYVNAAYRALFGREPDGVSGHECFSEYPNPSGGPCAACPVPAAIRSHKPAFVQSERPQPSVQGASIDPGTAGAGAEAEAEAHSTARRIFQRWMYPVIAPDGSIDEVVELIKDVTEQERLREASREADALRVADRLKAELLGTVSHELRSPLAAIKGYAGTLLRHDGRLAHAERREFLTAISETSDRLEAIIDQLLLMSQLETGLITPQHASVDPRQLAREAVTGSERRLSHNSSNSMRDTGVRHRIVVVDHTTHGRHAGQPQPGQDGDDVRGEVPLLVMGDRRLLRQALDEVLDNAVKYSPEGAWIEVILDRLPPQRAGVPDAPPMVALCVRDEGHGIPAEHLERVFDRFHRVDTGLTSTFGGLGLAICKRIIELHGGVVRIESEPGKGTKLCLLLPGFRSAGDANSLAGSQDGGTEGAPASAWASDSVDHMDTTS